MQTLKIPRMHKYKVHRMDIMLNLSLKKNKQPYKKIHVWVLSTES